MLIYKDVSSSYIKAIAFDDETGTLGAIFSNGSEYHYANVPAKTFHQVMGAESVGTAFDELIKRGKFVFKRAR
jgi:hypothetical protein